MSQVKLKQIDHTGSQDLRTTAIILLGEAGAGKTTLANLLVNALPCEYLRHASPIDELVMRLCNVRKIPDEWKLPGVKLPIIGLTYRETYETIGPMLRAKFGDKLFSDSLIDRASKSFAPYHVIEDCRRPVEVKALINYYKDPLFITLIRMQINSRDASSYNLSELYAAIPDNLHHQIDNTKESLRGLLAAAEEIIFRHTMRASHE